jgi:long-chain acyl-CoA synthetase
LKNDDPKVPAEINLQGDSSLVDILEQSVENGGTNISYINMGKSITFAELDRQSMNFTAY